MTVFKGSCHCTAVQFEIHSQELLQDMRRVAPDEFGFNLACIEGINPAVFADAPMTDGRSLSLADN